jgi:hypothetical protein
MFFMNKVFLILYLLISLSSSAQVAHWSFLSNAFTVYKIVDNGDSLLCMTNAGIIMSDKTGSGYRLVDAPDDYLYSRTIAMDSSGNFWIAISGKGIYSFNAGSWINYNTSNSSILSNDANSIRFLNGKVWIAHGSGLSSFNGFVWEIFTTANSGIPDNYVNDVSAGTDGVLWVATGNGLGSYANSAWTVFSTVNSPIAADFISAISVDDSNHVWIASLDYNLAGSFAAGIFMYDGANWNSFPSALYPGSQVNTIHCGKNQQVIFGSHTSVSNGWFSSGVSVYNGTTWNFYNSSNSLLTNYEVFSITSDTSGTIFIGTQGDYIFILQNGSFQTIRISNCDIPSGQVKAIGVSGSRIYTSSLSTNVQWPQEFLSYYNGLQWTQLDTIDDECKFIRFINDSVAYAGYGYNLHFLKGNNDSIVPLPSVGGLNDLCIDSSGSVWISTSNGIAKYDASAWTVYNTSNSGLPDDYVSAIIASGNNIWTATSSGIAFFNNSTWMVYDSINSPLLSGYISSMCISDSVIYLGSFQQSGWPIRYRGIQKIDLSNNIPLSWTLIDTSNSNLPSNNVSCIKVNNGEIWAGTSQGVIRLDTSLVYTTINSPLLNNNIYDITFDNTGGTWFANDRFVSIATTDSLSNKIISPYECSEFTLFPNPASEFIKILSADKSDEAELFIYTYHGSLVKNEKINLEHVINIKELMPGMYVFRFAFAGKKAVESSVVIIR